MAPRCGMGNAPQQTALESVEHQILSSMTGCPNSTSTHILRIETGCRSFESWADQRKLEYFFKLQEMPAAEQVLYVGSGRGFESHRGHQFHA
jgi:hypothetical protein